MIAPQYWVHLLCKDREEHQGIVAQLVHCQAQYQPIQYTAKEPIVAIFCHINKKNGYDDDDVLEYIERDREKMIIIGVGIKHKSYTVIGYSQLTCNLQVAFLSCSSMS